MDWQNLLLTVDGRINRAPYWMGVGVCFALLVAGFVLWALIPYLGALIAVVAFLASLGVSIVIGVKRLHDRGKSGKWLAVLYGVPMLFNVIGGQIDSIAIGFVFVAVSLAVSVWGLVELGILPGTDGPNAYGPDPRESAALRTA